jgi:thiol-disulfide isomerase/thioredoxin
VWATWCGPCIVEFPELVTMNRMYRGRPFEFVSLSADDPERSREVIGFLKKQQASNLNYHFSSPDKDALAEALDPQWNGALPHTILVKPGGGIAFRHTGEIDPLELKRAIVGYLGRTYN